MVIVIGLFVFIFIICFIIYRSIKNAGKKEIILDNIVEVVSNVKTASEVRHDISMKSDEEISKKMEEKYTDE